jgi:superfamily II DNA/RNA helicase
MPNARAVLCLFCYIDNHEKQICYLKCFSRCVVAIGGYNTIDQAKALAKKPHVVIATPGRIRALMEAVELAAVFSHTKVGG